MSLDEPFVPAKASPELINQIEQGKVANPNKPAKTFFNYIINPIVILIIGWPLYLVRMHP